MNNLNTLYKEVREEKPRAKKNKKMDHGGREDFFAFHQKWKERGEKNRTFKSRKGKKKFKRQSWVCYIRIEHLRRTWYNVNKNNNGVKSI